MTIETGYLINIDMRKTALLTCAIVLCNTMMFAQSRQKENPMIVNALTFIDVPYVANTLEQDGEEQLIFNCDEVDCTTLVEYVLAMSLCDEQGKEMSENQFAENLQKIRYRNGVIDGYTSRLHYMTDWINNGVSQGLLEDVTAENSPYTTKVNLGYMTRYPERYKQLANSSDNVKKMKKIEQLNSGSEVHWLPKDKLPHSGLPYIKNGDIILITSNTPGLDISHVGIAIYVKDALCMLHASSDKEKVIVEPLTLRSYLAKNDKASGIRVVRAKM